MDRLWPEAKNQELMAISFRIVERLKTIIAPLIVIEVFLTCCNIINSFDFPWQFAEGEFILNHGYPAKSVLHAYGEVSPHFENEYILYEVLIAGVDRTIGWIGLCFFFGLLCFLIYLPCLMAFLWSKNRFVLMDVCLFALAQFLVNMRLAARPELIAETCYILAGIMLMRWPGRSWNAMQTMAFGLVFCLWANAQGSFLLGLAMLGLWYGQMFLSQGKSLFFDFLWIRPAMAALTGCVLNPFGLFRLDQPFRLHAFIWGQATSLEMWPVTSGAGLLPLTWAGAAILALIMRVRERKYYWMIAMLFLLLYLSFASIRYTLFIGLSLLIITWDGLMHPREPFIFPFFPLFFALARFGFYFGLTMGLFWMIWSLVHDKVSTIRNYSQYVYPKTQIPTDSSCRWLREHPAQSYNLLSNVAAGSWAQMPGINGIHPLIDSGTHRYSDRMNQLFYYTLFSPKTFRLVLSKLNINAIDIDGSNIYWASILNGNPDWCLTHIEADSQLYLRKDNQAVDADRKLFFKWESEEQRKATGPAGVSSERVIRGLKLRPDLDSLKLLQEVSDVRWMADPQIVYIQDWLGEVSDDPIMESLKQIGNKMDNSSIGLRILLLLRLGQYQQADDIAQKWHPAVLNMNYQDLEMLRVEAFIHGGDLKTAQKILSSFWPKPRYSLRWAGLCRQVYGDDTKAEPENAHLLTGVDERMAWKEDLITLLNRNIDNLSAHQTP
ncbi:MAG TPA: hypothetical protein VL981_02045 [Candidatus Methylacidiphilales bacterium]|nr:hypothetical protein [Candidatus Methylacidiphilales bacterium]